MTLADRPDWTQAPVALVQQTVRLYVEATEITATGILVAAVAGRAIIITQAQLIANGLIETAVRGQIIASIGWGDLALAKRRLDLAISPESPSNVSTFDASSAPLPVGEAVTYLITTTAGVGRASVLLACTYYLAA